MKNNTRTIAQSKVSLLSYCFSALLIGSSVSIVRAQSSANDTTTPNNSTSSYDRPATTASAESPDLSHKDKHFIREATESSTNEVALSRIAAERTTNPEIKAFAQQMLADHQQLNSDLQALASQKGIDVSKAVEKGNSSDIESLSNKSPKDFDEAYIKRMASSHEDAVDLFKNEVADGQDKDTVALAARYLPIVTAHCQHAKDLKKAID